MYATYVLVAVNVAVFVYGVVTGVYGTWLELYTFTGTGFLAGNIVSVVTAGFLHSGVSHLLFNMVFLLVFGEAAEPVFGPVKTVALFLSGVVLGNAAFAALFPAVAAVGASGGVFAVMAAAMLVNPGNVVRRWIPIPISVVAVFYILGAVAQMFTLEGGVAHVAHVGGAVAGSVAAFYWEPKKAGKGVVVAVMIVLVLAGIGVIRF